MGDKISKPDYDEKYLKTKIKSYGNRINTNFHGDRMPKEDFHCVCLSLILINSVFKKIGKNSYPQVVLEECEYIVKERKMAKFINDEL